MYMTNEEAIKEVKEVYNDLEFKYEATTALAFDSAFSALENIDRITAERDAAVDDLHECETVNMSCFYCKHYEKRRDSEEVLKNKDGICCGEKGVDLWEWRGIE